MPLPSHRKRAAVAGLALILVIGACSGGGGEQSTTSAPAVTSTASSTPPPPTTGATTIAPVTTAVTTTSRPPTNLPPPPTSTIPAEDDRIAEAGNDAAATALEAETLCLTAVPAAILGWSITAGMGDSLQRIDVATARNGFDLGVFASGMVEPGRASVLWDAAASGAVHYWRVLTFVDGVWNPSATATFEGPFCIADQPGEG